MVLFLAMEHLFVTDKFEVTSEIEFHSQLVIPCIPTSQSYDVQLFTDSEVNNKYI